MTNTPEIIPDDPAYLYLNLHPEEKVLMLIRHHWAGFLDTFFIITFIILGPAVFLAVFHNVLASPIAAYGYYLTLLLTVYYLVALTVGFGTWLNYYFDLIIITNRRFININQIGLLSRQTSELTLEEIEDVTADVNGFLHSYLNYGLLVIETAGKGTSGDMARPGYFTVSDIPNPSHVARIISDLRRELGSKDGGE